MLVEMFDERTAAEHLEAARDRVLGRARSDPALAAQIGGVTARVNEQRFGELMQELAKHRARVRKLVAAGMPAAFARVRTLLGLTEGESAGRPGTAAAAASTASSAMRRYVVHFPPRTDTMPEGLTSTTCVRASAEEGTLSPGFCAAAL